MAFHNLTTLAKTSSIPVQQIKSLLGLGLKYCPFPRYTMRKKTHQGHNTHKIQKKPASQRILCRSRASNKQQL
eukprot:6225426-Ditylum_brightwellii.AAC.1